MIAKPDYDRSGIKKIRQSTKYSYIITTKDGRVNSPAVTGPLVLSTVKATLAGYVKAGLVTKVSATTQYQQCQAFMDTIKHKYRR